MRASIKVYSCLTMHGFWCVAPWGITLMMEAVSTSVMLVRLHSAVLQKILVAVRA
jgi:hypothetical protein